MTSTKNDRPSLGFGDELDTLDVAQWPASKSKAAKPEPEAVRRASEAAGFRSREAKAEVPKPLQRRRRTGRNAQLNLKARPETIAAFTRIADAKGWGLGEAFEHATALLEKEYDNR